MRASGRGGQEQERQRRDRASDRPPTHTPAPPISALPTDR
jgi:hypothetical protein